jgi:hypothetical protein
MRWTAMMLLVIVCGCHKEAPKPAPAPVMDSSINVTGIPGYQVCSWMKAGDANTTYVYGVEVSPLTANDKKMASNNGWLHICVTTSPIVDDAKDREIARLKAELAKAQKNASDSRNLVRRALKDMDAEGKLVHDSQQNADMCLASLTQCVNGAKP